MSRVTVTKCDHCGEELPVKRFRRSLLGQVNTIHIKGSISVEGEPDTTLDLTEGAELDLDFCNDQCLKAWLREERDKKLGQGELAGNNNDQLRVVGE